MFNRLKSQKGITGIDLSISIIIIMLFVSIIAAISINVSSSLASKRRLEAATNCMTEIMEKLDSINYDDVELIADFENIKAPEETYTDDTDGAHILRETVQNILAQKDENDEYKYRILQVQLKTEGYVPENYTPENEGDTAPDLIKKVTVKITYKLNDQDETIEVTRLKTRYNVDFTEPATSATN